MLRSIYSAKWTVSPWYAIQSGKRISYGKRLRTWLAGVGHEKMWAEDLDFVLVAFHFHDRASGNCVCSDDNIALACESE